MGKMTMNFGGKDMEVDDLVNRMPKNRKAPSLNDIKPLPNAKPTKQGDYKNYATPVKSFGTNEGTDQASAERNLRQEYENMKADERQKKGRESFDSSPMKKGGKVKKYADGGQIQGQVQQPTYPFYGNTPQAGGQNGGMNQTFNMQPQANADSSQQPQQRFKKGGAVKSASARADGCAIRGKTRA